MRGTAKQTVEEVADSYAHWWRDMGLHCATSPAAHGWRTQLAAPVPANEAVARPVQPPVQPVVAAAPTAQLQIARPIPNDLPGFLAWLARDPAQPEAHWSGPAILPSPMTEPRLTMLVEMPDDHAHDAATPFSPERARFVSALLASIGLTIDHVALAPLAFRRPPGGLLDDESFAALSERMRRYLALSRPRALLILSDRTSRALLDGQGGAAQLRSFAHDGGAVPAIALASPDHLMRRASAKAASWQALRLLHGIIAL